MSTAMTPALEPCPNPWCDEGVLGIEHREGGFFRVGCTCGVAGPANTNEEEAIRLWNHRTHGEASEVERLRGAAKALLSKVDGDRSVRWRFFNELASLRAALSDRSKQEEQP